MPWPEPGALLLTAMPCAGFVGIGGAGFSVVVEPDGDVFHINHDASMSDLK